MHLLLLLPLLTAAAERPWPFGPLPTCSVKVVPDHENFIANRLAGEWVFHMPITNFLKVSNARLGIPEQDNVMLSFKNDASVLDELAVDRCIFLEHNGRRVYSAGTFGINSPSMAAQFPYVLIDHHGTSAIVYWPTTGPDAVPMLVQMAPGMMRDHDLLILGEGAVGQPFGLLHRLGADFLGPEGRLDVIPTEEEHQVHQKEMEMVEGHSKVDETGVAEPEPVAVVYAAEAEAEAEDEDEAESETDVEENLEAEAEVKADIESEAEAEEEAETEEEAESEDSVDEGLEADVKAEIEPEAEVEADGEAEDEHMEAEAEVNKKVITFEEDPVVDPIVQMLVEVKTKEIIPDTEVKEEELEEEVEEKMEEEEDNQEEEGENETEEEIQD